MSEKKNAPWLQALHAVMPLCISYILAGLICGVLLQKVGFDPLLSGLLSILIFSGGTQFLVAFMFTTQASSAATLLMIFFLELCYTLLGASLTGFVRKERRTFLAVFSQSLNNKNYVVDYLKLPTDPPWDKRKALYVSWFSMTTWAGSNTIGSFFGLVVRVDADLVRFALTAMSIFMFITQMKNALLIFAGLFSGVLGVVFMILLQNTFGLAAAIAVALFVGFMLGKAFKKEKAKKLKGRDKDVNELLFNSPEQETNHHD